MHPVRCGHAAEQRRRHERGDDQAIVAAGVAQDVVGEQPADLVAAEPPPAAVGRGDGRTQPVGVGVVGDGDRRVRRCGQRQQQVHRARFLRVREAHRGEGAVWLLLLGHHERCGQSGPLERGEQRCPTHPVQRGVGSGSAGEIGPEPHRRHGCEIGIDVLGAEHLDERMVGRRQLDGARVDGVDARGDLLVGGRHDLRAGAEVHLVAVVGGRVVAGGDHHPGRGTHPGDVPRQHRRGDDVREQQRPNPTGSAHPRRVEREGVALATGVEADDHARPGTLGHGGQQVVGQPGGGLAHDEAVHALRARPHGTAQPGRAELQTAGEPLHQLVGRPGQQRRQLGAHIRVRFGGQPALGGLSHHGSPHRGSRVFSSTSGRGPTCEITSAAAIEPRRAHSGRLWSRV